MFKLLYCKFNYWILISKVSFCDTWSDVLVIELELIISFTLRVGILLLTVTLLTVWLLSLIPGDEYLFLLTLINPPKFLKQFTIPKFSIFLTKLFEILNFVLIKKWYKKAYIIPHNISKSIEKLFTRQNIINTNIG